jgi:hypothetical protein
MMSMYFVGYSCPPPLSPSEGGDCECPKIKCLILKIVIDFQD